MSKDKEMQDVLNQMQLLMAENERLRAALSELALQEQAYRKAHDLHGDGHIHAGRAWDAMRRAGDRARNLLTK